MASKYFHLTAHFHDEESAEKFSRFFHGVTLKARPELSYRLREFSCNVAVEKLSERTWRCRVVPQGDAMVSSWSLTKDQLGGLKVHGVTGGLYHHLRSAPTFDLAMVGFDHDDVLERESVLDAVRRAEPGLVVSVQQWDMCRSRHGVKAPFVHFADGNVWIPTKGLT